MAVARAARWPSSRRDQRRYSSKLAGDTGNHLSPSLRTLCESYDAPVLLATGASTEVAEVIKRHTAKLSINDNERVAAAIDHYEPHIDFDKLLE